MKTRAIFIGIDNYAHAPLTSSVQDAIDMRAKLSSLRIVADADCTLLTSALATGANDLPTRNNLSRLLLEARDNPGRYERLIVFFSGHGEMTFSDPDSSRPRTIVLPVDFEGRPFERYLNIDVDELIDQFRIAGPREQLFIFDCCRKQADVLGKDAGGGPLRWPAAKATSEETVQAILYGVALKGVARGVKAQGGVMTRHILDALDPRGPAATYLVERDEYAVTIDSLTDYVSAEVDKQVRDAPNFADGYDLPSLDRRGWREGRKLSPLLAVASTEVPRRSLVVIIEPPEAIPVAEVQLTSVANPLHQWPPSAVPCSVMPGTYGLRASLRTGGTPFLAPQPAFEAIDVRQDVRKVIRFRKAGEPPSDVTATHADVKQLYQDYLHTYELRTARDSGWTPGSPPPPGSKHLVAAHYDSAKFQADAEPPLRPYPSGTGRIVAFAQEAGTSVEFRSAVLPLGHIGGFVEYVPATNQRTFEAFVPPGYYTVHFRLGQEVFSQAQVEVVAGKAAEVRARAGATPMILETLPHRFVSGDVVAEVGEISESIGSLQGGVVATLLPALAMRAFDERDEFLSHFPADLRIAPQAWPHHPVSVIVAVDGPLPPNVSFDTLFAGAALRVRPVSEEVPARERSYVLEPFPPREPSPSLHRYGRAIFDAPATNFSITLQMSLLPTPITAVVAALPNRVSVATFLLKPRESCRFGLSLFQFPARADRDEAGNIYEESFPKRLHALQTAQSLFAASQLLAAPLVAGQIAELLQFKWMDPIVAVMLLLEMRRQRPAGLHVHDTREASANLARYFGDLPDSIIVRALYEPPERRQALESLRAARAVPVLAESLRQLVFLAQNAGLDGDPWMQRLVRRATTLQLEQPWSLSLGEPT